MRLNTQRSLKIIGWDKRRCTNSAGCKIFQRWYVNKSGFRWQISQKNEIIENRIL